MDDRMQATWKFYEQKGIGSRAAPGERPALLIVDMTNGFTDPDSPLGSDLSGPIAAVQELLEAARARGVPVYYTTDLYDTADPGGKVFAEKVPAIQVLAPGSKAVEVDDRIAPAPGERVVEKRLPSAFFGTDLHEDLQRRGVDTLIVTGCSTSGCIRASATDSMSWGYRTVVVREAVGDRAEGPHEANLFDIDAKIGDVISLADALRYLEGIPQQQPAAPPRA